MTRRWLPLHTLLAIVLSACAFNASADATGVPAGDGTGRQILVMLRTPPSHFRPDASYLGSYDPQSGRKARERIAEGLAADFKLRIVDSWPMPSLGVDCFVMEVTEGVATERVVEELSSDTRVDWVQGMNLFHVLAHNDPLFPIQPAAKAWHLAELHRIATGKNVRVAEIDSGVDTDHPDLRGRIAVTRNFVSASGFPVETHGTAVAGIIAARADDGVGIVGVAPQSELMALRACWETSSGNDRAVCSSFTLAKALQFALERNANIINLSLGGPSDRLLSRLLEVALSRGIAIVAAADPGARDGGFPSSLPGVLAVSMEDAHDPGPAILLVPGRDIPATLPGNRWGLVSGSSFAAAELSGLVALLIELAPRQNSQQIRETLAASDPSTPTSRRTVVDACAAVARTVGACACGCSVARVAGALPSP